MIDNKINNKKNNNKDNSINNYKKLYVENKLDTENKLKQFSIHCT